jgi:hypothetical protein
MERLAQLKPSEIETRNPQCPPDSVWLEFAAGIYPDPEELLSHAAQCDHCAPLLNDAVADLTSQLTPQEQAQMARLGSVNHGWQRDLARNLSTCGRVSAYPAEAQLVGPPSEPPRRRVGSWPVYAVGTVILIGFVLLGVLGYRRMVSLSGRDFRASEDIHQPDQSVASPGARVTELAAETKEAGAGAGAPEPRPAGNAQVASLVLEPGLTRGIGELKRLTVPQGASVARVTLRLEETPDAAVREELVTAEGEMKWSQEVRPSASDKRGHRLLLLLPASLLMRDDYQIVLSRQSPDGFERFATYTFRVIR